MTRDEFSKRIAFLVNELYEADEYFRAYVHLYNQQVDNVQRLNECPGFFQLALKAFLEMSVMNLARLYDCDRETISLLRIPLWIEQSKELRSVSKEDNSLEQIKTFLEKCTNIQSNLKVIRDKFLAHSDKKQLQLNIWSEAGITIGDYRLLIDSAHNILGLCTAMLDQSIPALGIGIESDIDRLMFLLSVEDDNTFCDDEIEMQEVL